MKQINFTLIIVFFALVAKSQNYPDTISVGASRTITADQNTSTLWILKDSQYKNAVTKAKELKLANEQIKEMAARNELQNTKSKEKDSLISIITKDRDYYKKNWETTEEDLKTMIGKSNRQKMMTRLSLAGVVVAFIVGFFIGK